MSESLTVPELVERARGLVRSGERRILGIAGGPGAGKSTLGAALLDGLGEDAVLVGMDGFHLAQDELVRLGRADRKGAPDTFDVDGYAALLRRLAAQLPGDADVYAPVFDRGLEQSIGSSTAVRSDVPLVITEGNWILLSDDPWGAVRPLLDEAWFVDLAPRERRRRLVARRLSHGHPRDEAEAWVTGVDEPNALVAEGTRPAADLVVSLAEQSMS